MQGGRYCVSKSLSLRFRIERRVEHGMVLKAEPEMIAALEVRPARLWSPPPNNHARDPGSAGVEYSDWGDATRAPRGTREIGGGKAHGRVVMSAMACASRFLANVWTSPREQRALRMSAWRDGVARMRRSCGADWQSARRNRGFDARREEYSPKPNPQRWHSRRRHRTRARCMVGPHPTLPVPEAAVRSTA